MFCFCFFFLDTQACGKACYFLVWYWGNARHPPSSARSPQLSREACVVKGTQRTYYSVPWGRVWSLSSFFPFVFLSSHYPPLCLRLLPKGLSDIYSPGAGCLQSLESAAVMGMVRHFGHSVLKTWMSGFLCTSGCSSDVPPCFLCSCALLCLIWNFFSTLLNPIAWFSAESSL